MTDALSSLYPTVQIGADGFNWWIGQIESVRDTDPKQGDRWKVRIIGLHPRTCDAVPSTELPWASCMMPVTNPHKVGGIASVSSQLDDGCWVVGFFLDQDKQQPIIMGSIGRVPNSKTDEDEEKPDPDQVGCNAFTTYLDPEKVIAFEQSLTDKRKPTTTGSGITTDDETVFTGASDGNATQLNPAGKNVCVELADKCGKETDMSKTFMRLFSEMLYETQRNNGKLGDYLVGEVTGEMYSAIGIGRKYVNKAIKIIRTFVARVKGFIVEQLKSAVKDLTDALLRPSETGNALTPVTEFFNNMLKQVGCEMADLGDRLIEFLTDLIFGYLFNIYKAAVCHVDQFVQGILAKIQSLMEDLLQKILGPLQAILGAIAAPLNMIGDAINYVLNLLGITCNGPAKECSKTTKVCSKGDTDEREDDFLDKILEGIDNTFGDIEADWSQYTCEEAYEGIKLPTSDVTFIGGIQDPIVRRKLIYTINDITVKEGEMAVFTVRRSGHTSVSSSVAYSTRNGTAQKGSDYEEQSGIVGFAPGETEKYINIRTFADALEETDEDFYVRIRKDTPGTVGASAVKNVARCIIQEYDTTEPQYTDGIGSGIDPTPSNIVIPSRNPNIDDLWTDPVVADSSDGRVTTTDENGIISVDGVVQPPTYQIIPDKVIVKEGEFITYTIKTTNVAFGRNFTYSLFGVNITPSDIVSKSLNGSFIVEDLKDSVDMPYSAKVVVGIEEDSLFEDEELLIFSIPGTGASASVLIESSESSFSEEEVARQEDSSSTPVPDSGPQLPTVGEIITDTDGGIIEIPIADPGDPYREPPQVLITGNGYRAAGIALLDKKGILSEIRITDPGYDYKINTSSDANKECIIDSFTMIRPGQGYTSTPTVTVDGDPTVADALVNTKGQVISVRIKNRSRVFETYPKVRIMGGGGYGAKFLPSFICLDSDERVRVGSAKIGTGSYIDCP
tara:strand:- start:733 stop:3600 length:2868 start_codon:yes stop_codon:yes gene_type:complete